MMFKTEQTLTFDQQSEPVLVNTRGKFVVVKRWYEWKTSKYYASGLGPV